MNPAVAYSMQQGAVDQKDLGKPSYAMEAEGPSKAFMIDQRKTVRDKDAVKLHFGDIESLLIDYADSNIYEYLSAYTGDSPRLWLNVKKATVVGVCLGKLCEHVNFNSHRLKTYQDITEEIFGYLETTYQV